MHSIFLLQLKIISFLSPLFYPFKLKLVASEGLRISLLIYDLNCHTLFNADIKKGGCCSLFSCWAMTPWTATCQASLSFSTSQSLLKLMSIESVMPSNHLILCCPLLLLTSIFPSIRVFSNESGLHNRWSKYCSFSIILLMNKKGGKAPQMFQFQRVKIKIPFY